MPKVSEIKIDHEKMLNNVTGLDNYQHPKQDYIARIKAMTDKELSAECESKIWLSAYAANNPRSDYHWHVDALWNECGRRNSPSIYDNAYKQVEKQAE